MDYDPSPRSLFRPEAVPAFQRPDPPPFDPDAAGYSAANAWWLANAALLAYYDPEALASPEDVAETYWWVHKQPKGAWSNEVELRPHTETWTC